MKTRNSFAALVALAILGSAPLFSQSQATSGSASAISLYTQGMTQLDREQTYQAIELFKQAQALNRNYIDPLIGLASAYYYLDEYDEALRYVNLAVPLGRDNSRLLNINGRILLALGKTSDAAAIFRLILAKEPYNVDALLGLAEFSLSRGDEISALQQYQKSLQYNSKDRRILLALSLMYEEKGDRKTSEQYLLKALDAFPESPMVQAMAAEYYLRRQDYAQAQFHAQTALTLFSGYPEALELLGTVYLYTGKYPEVVATMDQVIKGDAQNSRAWYLRGMALLQQQKPQDAIDSFTKALGVAPNDEITRIVLEDTLDKNFKTEDPLRTRYAAYHLDQAAQYQAKNLNTRALFHYRRAMLLAPTDTNGRQSYADFLKSIGQNAQFYQQLKALSGLGLQNNFVKDNLEIYGSLLQDSVSSNWGVDQFTIDRDPLLFRIYYIPANQSIEHPMAEPYLAHYAQQLLQSSVKVSFSKDRNEFSDTVAPQAVSSPSEAFSDARTDKADYYVLLDLSESGEDFEADMGLYLARTGNRLRQYSAFRTGNFRVQNAVYQVTDSLQQELPLRGRLLKRNLNDGMVNLGAVDGLKAKDTLTLVSPDAYVLRGDAPGFIYTQEKKTGTFTVGQTDDFISSGTVLRDGFFDRINIGDVILKDGESQGKSQGPTSNFPFLYNKIRAIR